MKYAIFRCCPTPQFLPYYERSTDAVMTKLGVTLVDIKDFNCCGYPLRSTNKKAYLLASVRNLALAAAHDLDIVTLCNCCYESLKQAKYTMDNDQGLGREISAVLEKEALTYDRATRVRHIFEILLDEIGIDTIKGQLEATYSGLKIATHYGCHLLRPSRVLQFDDPVAPKRFDALVGATGAESVDWSSKLDCCGAPALGVNDELSIKLTEKKVTQALNSGADFFCVACVYCQLQFDRIQHRMITQTPQREFLAPILYTELLGLALGIAPETLGLDQHRLEASGLSDFLAETPVEVS